MSRVAVDLVCRSLFCFGIAAAIAGLVREPTLSPEVDAGPVAAFGIYDDMGDFIATDTVPLVTGQQFGWRLAVDDVGLHTWREVLITPAAPREWIGADLMILDEGKVGITERTEAATEGVLEHAWTITDGDPAGPHVVEIWLDGRLVKRFAFEVKAQQAPAQVLDEEQPVQPRWRCGGHQQFLLTE